MLWLTSLYVDQHLATGEEPGPGHDVLTGRYACYDTYRCSDGKWISVGCLEPQFYASLVERLGLAGEDLPEQMDRSQWPALKQRLAEIFVRKTRDEWCSVFEDSDACFAPVLSMSEAHEHPHNAARGTFVLKNGARQPHPAPRFSRTAAKLGIGPAKVGENPDEVLAELGFSLERIASLRDVGAVQG